MNEKVIFWFRRDLRLEDNTGLYQALTAGKPVMGIFIFDTHILRHLPRKDARVEFIHLRIQKLHQQLLDVGSSLWVYHGQPEEILPGLVKTHQIQAVYTNHDYEPYATERDQKMAAVLENMGCGFHTSKDQVIFEKQEILTNSQTPYTVFTPYSRKWKALLTPSLTAPFDSLGQLNTCWKAQAHDLPSLESLGFEPTGQKFPSPVPDPSTVKTYHETRDFPSMEGTTRLGLHLRFGTISIRGLVKRARELNETYLNELIWREFYMQILWNFPYVVEGPFRKEYAPIPWSQDEAAFQRWCEGKTGFPMVDAGMRELNETGYMHNRVRMITASFLVKHLLINWQWGEAYFAEKLLDFELSSNNGGWQWAAGCGTDAAPYFRIFNPESQMKKFDPKGKYIRKWVPEMGTPAYPRPMVEHKQARERALATFKEALASERAS